jgi:hypothetical protein
MQLGGESAPLAKLTSSWKEVAELRRQDPGIKLVSPAVASDKGWLKVSRMS